MTGRTRLTTRAAMLGVVLAVLALTLVYPLRLYVAQRSQTNALAAQNEAERERVEKLQQTVKAYDNPDWVRDQARARLHYTVPGEQVYVVTPTPTPVPTAIPTGRPTAPTSTARTTPPRPTGAAATTADPAR